MANHCLCIIPLYIYIFHCSRATNGALDCSLTSARHVCIIYHLCMYRQFLFYFFPGFLIFLFVLFKCVTHYLEQIIYVQRINCNRCHIPRLSSCELRANCGRLQCSLCFSLLFFSCCRFSFLH